MIFGPVPINESRGSILAHSLSLPDGPMRKGLRLGDSDLERLSASGLELVIVARLEPGDIDEDEAAARIGAALVSEGLRLGPISTGRVNLFSKSNGLLSVDADRIGDLNGIDEGLTLATLPHFARVSEGQMVATVKVIPYALPEAVLAKGEAALQREAMKVHSFLGGRARLILTRTPGFRENLLQKGADAVRVRLQALGYSLIDTQTVDHDRNSIAKVLYRDVDLTLVLGASATSDRDDVAPAAVVEAGGRIERFGMPVDPGNLLFIGSLDDGTVVGLPGCARSPALNGVDWVLERLSAGIEISTDDIAAMGVGGLLKETPGRPHPRDSGAH